MSYFFSSKNMNNYYFYRAVALVLDHGSSILILLDNNVRIPNKSHVHRHQAAITQSSKSIFSNGFLTFSTLNPLHMFFSFFPSEKPDPPLAPPPKPEKQPKAIQGYFQFPFSYRTLNPKANQGQEYLKSCPPSTSPCTKMEPWIRSTDQPLLGQITFFCNKMEAEDVQMDENGSINPTNPKILEIKSHFEVRTNMKINTSEPNTSAKKYHIV